MPATHLQSRKGQWSGAYISWSNMIQRCTNPKNPKYSDYGGRGIAVCPRWRSFEHFYADMGDRPDGMSLERKNVNKGYYKTNCKWATPSEQANNQRDSLSRLDYKGRSYTRSELAKLAGLSEQCLNGRLERGWAVKEAVETPSAIKPKIPYKGKEYSAPQLEKLTGIPASTIKLGVRKGLTVAQLVRQRS